MRRSRSATPTPIVAMEMEIELEVNVSNPGLSRHLDYDGGGVFGGGSSSSSSSLASEAPIVTPGGLAMPLIETVLTLAFLSVITVSTIVGNVLVILSVFTYKPLRIAQNFFLVSLAVADLTVAVLVMPFNIVHTLLSRWAFGLPLCYMWLTCDVLCCTASILNLCAIALDRYWAIHDPINYAQKRTLKRVVVMIVLVWLVSGIICLPPLFGWNNWSSEFDHTSPCKLTTEPGYIVYSSCGSFFIPLVVMTTVYIKIFVATKRRLRERNRRGAASAAATSTTSGATMPHAGPVMATVATGSGRFGGGGSSTVATVMVVTPVVKSNGSSGSGSKTPSTPDKSMTSFGGGGGGGGSGGGRFTPPNHKEANHNDSKCRGGFLDPATRGDDDPSSVADEVPATSETHQLHKADSSTSNCRRLDNSSPIHQFVIERQKISLSKERRAARILGIVMGVFMVCWLPFFTMYVVLPFCSTCVLPEWLENIITWLGYVNSALNPVIYTIFNVDFRRAFARLLRCNARTTRR